MVNKLLHCQNISKTFGSVVAISELDLSINPGEIISILGPSGCGKTTLLRLIAGLDAPDEGSITLNNRILVDGTTWVPPHKRGVGMVFQEFALFPHKTVKENIEFGLSELNSYQKSTRVKDALNLTRITELENRFPNELSGGQQQRVALARTLATQPYLLLMDEPFSNLDSGLRSLVREEVKAILRETDTATIFVTHDREEAFSISDQVAIMLEGTVHQIDPPDKIYFWPNTKDVAVLSGGCDFIKGKIENNFAITSIGQLPIRVIGEYPDGIEVEIAIRPNDLTMTPNPNGSSRVIRKEFRGDDTLFWVESPSGEIICCKHKIHTTLFAGLRVDLSPEKFVTFNVFT